MTDHIVVFDGNERLVGRTVAVRVEEATAFTLFGTVLTGEQVGVNITDQNARELQPAGAMIQQGTTRMSLPLI